MCNVERKQVTSDLERITAATKTGTERLHDGDDDLGFDLLSFWQWSVSDLVSNVTRGVLAEYIVARALDAVGAVRDEWAAFDLLTPTGIKVEIKSAAFVQTWHQNRLSRITFGTSKTRAWDPDTGRLSPEAKRHAHVYVFAILAHKDKSTIDPLNIAQWEFFVLPTPVLDKRIRSQHSITLPSLKRLCGEPVQYSVLRAAVEAAAAGRNGAI